MTALPRRLSVSSQQSWMRLWGFLHWGWCRGPWGRCCQVSERLQDPIWPEGLSEPPGSFHTDHWARLWCYIPEAGPVMDGGGVKGTASAAQCVYRKTAGENVDWRKSVTAARVPEYVGASRRTLSPGLMSISKTFNEGSQETVKRFRKSVKYNGMS